LGERRRRRGGERRRRRKRRRCREEEEGLREEEEEKRREKKDLPLSWSMGGSACAVVAVVILLRLQFAKPCLIGRTAGYAGPAEPAYTIWVPWRYPGLRVPIPPPAHHTFL
jgi:hypothetical protein